jgi:protoporphyrinogen oxidase
MNGQESNKFISRRKFIYYGALIYSSAFISSCLNKSNEKKITLFYSRNSKQNTPLLSDKNFPEPSETYSIDTVIVGGGVSGLSAARWLHKNSKRDFILFEMDKNCGGNAIAGSNEITKYPYGANHLQLPNLTNTNLLEFLLEHQIITAYNEQNMPMYNEQYLCAQPQQRFYYKGIWLNEMPPKKGLSEKETENYNAFMALMQYFQSAIGTDNKPAFASPIDNASIDELFVALDDLDIISFLKMKGFDAPFLFWFVDYCCKSNFGSKATKTSAWAAIHYFAARNGSAANAKSTEVLSWPEGNSFLVQKLASNIADFVKPNCIVYQIRALDNAYECYVYDVYNKKSYLYNCNKLILATPQHINMNLLKMPLNIQWSKFNYYPWLVANIAIDDQKVLNGKNNIAWNNIIYNTKSLGYINAKHQDLNTYKKETVLTYYFNFSEQDDQSERNQLYDKDETYWKDFIINDLKQAHPTIDNNIICIDLFIWNKGMVAPHVGFLRNNDRKMLEKGFHNLYFANSDISGISNFEEAFHQGIKCANKILNKI